MGWDFPFAECHPNLTAPGPRAKPFVELFYTMSCSALADTERFTGYPKARSVMAHLYSITGPGRNISHNSSLVWITETVNDSWLQPREAGFG